MKDADQGQSAALDGEGLRMVAVRSPEVRRVDQTRTRRRESGHEGVHVAVEARVEGARSGWEIGELGVSRDGGRALRVEDEGAAAFVFDELGPSRDAA